ncbi:hypothetical protein [Paeniglutamicibacter sp. NPDC091659]|uniref:hypothetical protein n=1 Tax=Paeniglutamicibacter sp. NPDC091659 TaxID=3364389 RepID=UPI0037F9E0DE
MEWSDEPVVAAVRRGDLEAVLGLIESDRSGVLSVNQQLGRLFRLISAAPHAARSPEGHWVGELGKHHEAALCAHAACIGAMRAADLVAIPRDVLKNAYPRIFPTQLPAIVERLGENYQRAPKNWDKTGPYGVMFDWVARGHAPAPTGDGTVNNLLSTLRWSKPRERAALFAAAPDLATITLPRLFDAEVRPSLGAAALDWQVDPASEDRIDRQILALVRNGMWTPELVLDGMARFRANHTSNFQLRWVAGLESLLAQKLPKT